MANKKSQGTPVTSEETKVVPEPKVLTGTVCNCSILNVRKDPSMDAEILDKINSKSEVTILDKNSNNGWHKIETKDGIIGYCVDEFIKVNKWG